MIDIVHCYHARNLWTAAGICVFIFKA